VKRLLNRITLVCADTLHPAQAVISLRKSMEKCQFGAVKLFTDRYIELDGIEVVRIPTLNSKDDYSRWIVKELHKHFDTDFVLITQADSHILDPGAWTDSFFDYSYIGALWPWESDGFRNGNGGFSLRSKEFCQAVGTDPEIRITNPEDAQLCRLYRPYLEKTHGLTWAPDDLCERFAFECGEPTQSTFGFHGYFHQPFKPSVVISRHAALGDVLATEPILRYYHNKGYHVYLSTLPQFEDLFDQHDFPVRPARTKDGRIPFLHHDLNLAYESEPSQNHLQAYYNFCGIKDGPMVRPQLTQLGPPLFEKYVVIHLDNRDQPSRNVVGVNWRIIVDRICEMGYTVFQIGHSLDFVETGATRLHTHNIAMMKYIVGGASLFIGVDSGPANIAVAYGVPTVIFFGSVDANLIHPDLSCVSVIEIDGVCDTPKCWHSITGGVEGKECVVDAKKPPCVNFKGKERRILKEVEKWIGQK